MLSFITVAVVMESLHSNRTLRLVVLAELYGVPVSMLAEVQCIDAAGFSVCKGCSLYPKHPPLRRLFPSTLATLQAELFVLTCVVSLGIPPSQCAITEH